jgi:hypothetical protein
MLIQKLDSSDSEKRATGCAQHANLTTMVLLQALPLETPGRFTFIDSETWVDHFSDSINLFKKIDIAQATCIQSTINTIRSKTVLDIKDKRIQKLSTSVSDLTQTNGATHAQCGTMVHPRRPVVTLSHTLIESIDMLAGEHQPTNGETTTRELLSTDTVLVLRRRLTHTEM